LRSKLRLQVGQVDHRCVSAGGANGLRLSFVADKRRHFVAVSLKLREYVRSHESNRTGKGYMHDLSSFFETVSRTASCVSIDVTAWIWAGW
jgi:hypothetical protein